MLSINEKPPGFASRAIGILEGTIELVPGDENGDRRILLNVDDGKKISGIVQGKAKTKILDDPSLLFKRVRLLVYPRTERGILKFQTVDIEEVEEGSVCEQTDLFLIQGFNIGSNNNSVSKIAVRPNKKSKHNFEGFWLSLHGYLKDDLKIVYQVRAIRKGERLHIISSDPQLPKNGLSEAERRQRTYRRADQGTRKVSPTQRARKPQN